MTLFGASSNLTYPEPIRTAPREWRLDPVRLQREHDAGEADVRAVERCDAWVVVKVLQDAPAGPRDGILLPHVLRHPLLERPQVVQERLVGKFEARLEVGHAQDEELAVADGLANVVVQALQPKGVLWRTRALPVQRGVDDVDQVAQFELIRVRLQLARQVEAGGGHQLKVLGRPCSNIP